MRRAGLSPATGGFTIIELMTTIAIAGVILAVGIPSFKSMMAANRLSTQSNDLVSAVNYARSEAITRNLSVSLCRVAAAANDNCALNTTAATWQNWIVRTASGTVLRRGEVNALGGITVLTTLTKDEVVFGANGLSTTGGVPVSNKLINVCSTAISSNNIRRVTLGAGSRVSTDKVTGSC